MGKKLLGYCVRYINNLCHHIIKIQHFSLNIYISDKMFPTASLLFRKFKLTCLKLEEDRKYTDDCQYNTVVETMLVLENL